MIPVIIIMGVSGSGKTTVGKQLSDQLDLPFYDADDFHPSENIDKMRAGVPLQDADREPWLASMASAILDWKANKGAVLACSALKEHYRKALPATHWIVLNGSYERILHRMNTRHGHFMPAELLQSQFDTLEIPSYGLHIDCNHPIDQIIIKATDYILS